MTMKELHEAILFMVDVLLSVNKISQEELEKTITTILETSEGSYKECCQVVAEFIDNYRRCTAV